MGTVKLERSGGRDGENVLRVADIKFIRFDKEGRPFGVGWDNSRGTSFLEWFEDTPNNRKVMGELLNSFGFNRERKIVIRTIHKDLSRDLNKDLNHFAMASFLMNTAYVAYNAYHRKLHTEMVLEYSGDPKIVYENLDNTNGSKSNIYPTVPEHTVVRTHYVVLKYVRVSSEISARLINAITGSALFAVGFTGAIYLIEKHIKHI